MAKRANGAGSIYQRGDSRWAAAISFVDQAGVRRRRTFYGSTQREVKAKRDEEVVPGLVEFGWRSPA